MRQVQDGIGREQEVADRRIAEIRAEAAAQLEESRQLYRLARDDANRERQERREAKERHQRDLAEQEERHRVELAQRWVEAARFLTEEQRPVAVVPPQRQPSPAPRGW